MKLRIKAELYYRHAHLELPLRRKIESILLFSFCTSLNRGREVVRSKPRCEFLECKQPCQKLLSGYLYPVIRQIRLLQLFGDWKYLLVGGEITMDLDCL